MRSKKTSPRPLNRSSVEVSSQGGLDIYHSVVSMGWLAYLSFFACAFLVVNVVFGFLYYVGDSAIGGLQSNSYLEYFFFSVQTLATIGYGSKFPQTLYADILVTLEAMMGLLGLGMFTGIAFARLSIPRSRIIFSKVAVIAPFEGVPTLMFRVSNERNNRVIGAEVELTLFLRTTTKEGQTLRRIFDLPLLRNRTPMLSLTWLVFHPIAPNSPLFGHTVDSLAELDFALVATIKGLDETISQTVHANQTYSSNDIKWNYRFKDMFTENLQTGKAMIDLNQISEVEPLVDET
jgi:inward rectifier potassium channel